MTVAQSLVMPRITKVRTTLSLVCKLNIYPNSKQEWLKTRLDLVLRSDVTVDEILKDQHPTGFLSQVYFASVVVSEVGRKSLILKKNNIKYISRKNRWNSSSKLQLKRRIRTSL